MTLLRKRPEPERRWIFRPFYLSIIWLILALLLIINGTYEAKRAEENLYRMLLDEGLALIDGLEKNTQNVFASLATMEAFPEASALLISSAVNPMALEESIIDLVLEVAFQADHRIGGSSSGEDELRKIAEEDHFDQIELISHQKRLFYHRNPSATENGKHPPFYLSVLEGKASYAIQRSEKKKTGQMDDLWVAIRRKAGEGILVVRVREADLQYFRRWVLLQGLTEEWGRRGDLQFITFEGRDGEIWADTDPEKVGKKGEKGVWEPLFRKDEKIDPWMTRKLKGVFEIAKVVRLDQTKPSLLRVGLSTQRVEGIISADRRNILLFSVMLLIFGGVGMTFIYRMESRHLVHVREMEEKVHKSEKMSSLAYLAAGVAHEIRNPLNAIGLAIQRLQREFPPQDPEMRKEYDRFTNVLRGEVKRVNEIIEQFLFFARPARLELEPLAIKDILEDLFTLCQEAASQQGVILEKDIAPDLPSLCLDRKRIQEALLNLMNNGLQAMPQGGQLRVTAQRHDGREILIQVGDTGGGIKAENLTKIFDYYFTTKEGGMGLGLPLAHKIIEEHGGSIQVSSEEGKGTVFRVYLPLARDGK